MTGRLQWVVAFTIATATLVHSTPSSAQRIRWTEVHGGLAGGSSSLDTGGQIGIARDWTGRWTSVGFGASWIVGRTSEPEQQMWAMVLNGTARLHLPTEFSPYLEAGVNVYFVGYENIDEDERERSFVNPGPSLGAGLTWRARPDLQVRIGAAVHYAKIDVGLDGADEGEEWFTGLVGVSFR